MHIWGGYWSPVVGVQTSLMSFSSNKHKFQEKQTLLLFVYDFIKSLTFFFSEPAINYNLNEKKK